MRITPLDVRKQEFRRGMRGLDPEEVYAFLATVADEYEGVLNDNKALRERLLELDDKVQEYRTMERTLRDTLLTAERVNAEAKDNARREANIIIKEAQIEAEKALRDIKTEAMKLRSQVQQLRSQRDSYLARMKVVAESHLSYVDSAVSDFRQEDATLEDLNLADEPARDPRPGPADAVEPPASSPNLFETAKEVAGEEPATPKTVAPVPPPLPVAPAAQPAAPAAPEPSAPAVAAPPIEPKALGTDVGLTTGTVDPISVIIDRMKKGQQEILSTGAGSPGYTPDFTDRPSITTVQPTAGSLEHELKLGSVESSVGSPQAEPAMVDAGPAVAVAPLPEQRPLDETVELTLDNGAEPPPTDEREG